MKKYDLIVVGGGLTGVAAAVSAAREGMQVLLLEKAGALGGAMSNCFVYPFMMYWTKSPETGEKQYLSGGIFAEMRDRQAKYQVEIHDKHFSPEYFKMVLDDMALEAGVDVLFHANVYDVCVENRAITGLSVIAGSEKITLQADFYIDATGDGNVFYLAGCDYALGRQSDGLCQPMTTCFRVSNVDVELFKQERPGLQILYAQQQTEGKIKNPRENILCFYGIGEGVVHFNTTRVIKLNPTDPWDVSKAEMLARQQIAEMLHFLRENAVSCKNCALTSIASDIGVRESRKLRGEHILTEEDLKNCTKFADGIALGNYDIDIHNPSGTGTSHYYFKDGEYYAIPYRSLLPRELDNLLVAGRCISATHEAQASVRIMPICACMGEAAGTAIAVMQEAGANTHTVNVHDVQRKLEKNGAILKI